MRIIIMDNPRKPKKLAPQWSFLKQTVGKKREKEVETLPYSCKYCTKRFRTPNATAQHASLKHPCLFERGDIYEPSARKGRYYAH